MLLRSSTRRNHNARLLERQPKHLTRRLVRLAMSLLEVDHGRLTHACPRRQVANPPAEEPSRGSTLRWCEYDFAHPRMMPDQRYLTNCTYSLAHLS